MAAPVDPASPVSTAGSSMNRALLLSLSTGVLVPVVGLATAPILAQAVGAVGRGEVAAAAAPYTLIVSAATLGLPESMTWIAATRPALANRAFRLAALLSALLGAACVALVVVALPFLSAGDDRLAGYILIAAALGVPMLLVNLLHASSVGHQRWRRIAAEKVISAFLRLAIMIALLVSGHLTVLNAVLVLTLVPLIAGLVNLAVLWIRLPVESSANDSTSTSLPWSLVGYGFRSWGGAVAGVLLAKLGMILFLPLSDAEQLGLYVVAVTISDIPVILALALRETLFGVSARERDARRFATATRVAVLVATLGTLVLAVSIPAWIGPLFGASFTAAVPTAWILMLCSVINVPTFLLAAGLSAWGKPGRRSLAVGLTVIVDVVMFVLLVPHHGAVGAAAANLVSASVGCAISVEIARRTLAVRRRDLLVATRGDLALGRSLARRLAPLRRAR